MALAGSTVLVAGGSGFIGTNLCLRLVREGCRIRATHHSHRPQAAVDGIEFVEADLTLAEDCRRVVENVDYVFMCAANTSGAAVMTTTPLVHVTPNVIMNVRMLEASYAAQVRKYLFISSSAAYPPSGDVPVREEQMFDGAPYDTYYSVGWMKRYTEILCQTYAHRIKPRMPTVVVRPSNIYGPYDKFDFDRSHMMAALIRRVAERHEPLEVWGTGEDVRDLLYIDDFIEGMLLAFNTDEDFFVVNISSGEGHSVRKVLNTILEVDGYADADVRFDTTKPRTIPKMLIDNSLARERLGFTLRVPLCKGVARTLAWLREHSVA